MKNHDGINQDVLAKLVASLNINEEQAASMIRQEIARKEASKRYRQSEAYKLRLEQQKAVRQALKEIA